MKNTAGSSPLFILLFVPVGLVMGCGSNASDTPANVGASGAAGAGGSSGDRSYTSETFCSSALGQNFGDASLKGARLVASHAGNPLYCLISATLKSSINFQVALPENWNHRILFLGGGGVDRALPNIQTSPSPGTLAAGHAVRGDDSRHQRHPA